MIRRIRSLTGRAFTAALAGLFLCACSDFGDINKDPNHTDKLESRFLLSRAMQGTTFVVFNNAPAPSTSLYNPWTQLYPQYFAEAKNVQYTQFNIPQFSLGPLYLNFLRNIHRVMKKCEAPKAAEDPELLAMGDPRNQLGVAETLRAFYYMHLTDAMGMLYYSEAMKGDEKNFTPRFDEQKDIYKDLDARLKKAFDAMDPGKALNANYDFIYGGDVAKWKKLNASLRMMMAIKLHDVDPAAGKARFAVAYADGGIQSNKDNMCYQYLDENANMNPLYDNIMISGRKDFYPSKTLVDSFLALKDPRVLTYAAPHPENLLAAVPFGVSREKVQAYTGKVAELNPELYKRNYRLTIVSAAKILLDEAEAAARGWIAADAKQLYEQAIRASFENKNVEAELARYAPGGPEKEMGKRLKEKYALLESVDAYLQQAKVQLPADKEGMIKQIALQRWMNGFLEDGIEAWSDWRRLDQPRLEAGEASAALVSHIPYRRVFDKGDYEVNMAHYKEMLSKQGEDTFDTRVWWDVADNH